MDMLKISGTYFRETYPGVSPEAVGAFLLMASDHVQSIYSLAEALRLKPSDMVDHLNLLAEGQGAGLIRMVVMDGGDAGDQLISMTPTGMMACHELQNRLAASA